MDDLNDKRKRSEDETQEMPPDHTVIIDVPRELGSYRLTRQLGRGGMGEVWQAFDTNLERDVAIKLMRKELLTNEDATRRFAREARAVARLNHPNIVQVYAFGDEKGLAYFVMELVEGETVSQALKRQGQISLDDTLYMILQAIEGLSYANARGIIHRDIKPSNLMLAEGNRIKIADFGLAKMVEHDTQMTAAGTAMGSPNYMSPEQARGEEADHRSDIYALGISMYQMLCGSLPFTASSPVSVLLKQIQEPLPEPEALRILGDGRVLNVLRKMTEKSPDKRYQSYGELASDLAAIKPDLRVKGAHLITASMPAARPSESGSSNPAGAEGEQSDSLFAKPSDQDLLSTPPAPPPLPPDQTGIVSSRDGDMPFSTSMIARKRSKLIMPIVIIAAAVMSIAVIAALFLANNNDYQDAQFQQAQNDLKALPAAVTDESPSPMGGVEPTPTPIPATAASPTPSASPSPTARSMEPADIEVALTPKITPMPGVLATVTPLTGLADLAPSNNPLIVGGDNDAAGSSVPLYDATGNKVGTVTAGSVAEYIRPATLNNQQWYAIRHEGQEVFLKAENAHFAQIVDPPAHSNAPTPQPRTTYVLGTAGAGQNESVPTFLDNAGRNPYKNFPAGTEVEILSVGTTMLRGFAPDGRMVYIYKRMASPKP